MSDNWIVQNLENALETWNDKLSEIWALITMTPQSFRGGKIWNVIVDINGAVQSIGLALLVLFAIVMIVNDIVIGDEMPVVNNVHIEVIEKISLHYYPIPPRGHAGY